MLCKLESMWTGHEGGRRKLDRLVSCSTGSWVVLQRPEQRVHKAPVGEVESSLILLNFKVRTAVMSSTVHVAEEF